MQVDPKVIYLLNMLRKWTRIWQTLLSTHLLHSSSHHGFKNQIAQVGLINLIDLTINQFDRL